MVQNKFHYAITGQTGAEIVYSQIINSDFDKEVKKILDKGEV